MTEDDEEVDWDAIVLSNYASDIFSSRKWFEMAAELTACMTVLEPHVLAWWQSLREWTRENAPIFREHGFHLTYMMLAAFAIENLAKGVLVRQLSSSEVKTVQVDGELPDSILGHRLVDMVNRLGMSLSDDDLDLLARLESAGVWSGRYPAPRFYRASRAQTVTKGRVVSVNWKGSADVYHVKSLIRKIREYVGAQSSYRIPEGDA